MQEGAGGGVVVSDVACERRVVVVSLLVMWHVREQRCGVVVGNMAHRVASSLVTLKSVVFAMG